MSAIKLLNIALVLVAGSVLVSCGPGKKMKAANAQIADLNNQITALNTKLADNEKLISQLKAENIQYGREAEDCRKAKAAIAQKFENLQRNLDEQGTSMKKILQKADAAISRFQDAGANVTYKNGLVHINFTDKFFFKTGSSTIGVKGREALNTVAEVMRENPEITCVIIGNTDTVSVRGVADNWSLSTERANAVVRILHDTYNINPARLTAAGKSKYNPVASNNTPEGREQNRRIEIVLNPKLDRLWEMMENK